MRKSGLGPESHEASRAAIEPTPAYLPFFRQRKQRVEQARWCVKWQKQPARRFASDEWDVSGQRLCLPVQRDRAAARRQRDSVDQRASHQQTTECATTLGVDGSKSKFQAAHLSKAHLQQGQRDTKHCSSSHSSLGSLSTPERTARSLCFQSQRLGYQGLDWGLG